MPSINCASSYISICLQGMMQVSFLLETFEFRMWDVSALCICSVGYDTNFCILGVVDVTIRIPYCFCSYFSDNQLPVSNIYQTLNGQDSIGRYFAVGLKRANEIIGTTTEELVMKARQATSNS